MNQPTHILNQMGVLTSFSVAKKITEEDIDKFFRKNKRPGRNDQELSNMLKEKVLADIQRAVENKQIPGVLDPADIAREMGMDKNVVKNIPELNRLIIIVAHKLSEKKYDKMSLCYLINSLVNLLGLSESDFEKFHGRSDNDDDDGDDEEADNGNVEA